MHYNPQGPQTHALENRMSEANPDHPHNYNPQGPQKHAL